MMPSMWPALNQSEDSISSWDVTIQTGVQSRAQDVNWSAWSVISSRWSCCCAALLPSAGYHWCQFCLQYVCHCDELNVLTNKWLWFKPLTSDICTNIYVKQLSNDSLINYDLELGYLVTWSWMFRTIWNHSWSTVFIIYVYFYVNDYLQNEFNKL